MRFLIAISAFTLSLNLYAKGLDDIEAENPSAKEDSEALDAETGEAKPVAKPIAPAAAIKPVTEAAKTDQPEAEKPVVRSEISKKLDDRMLFAVGFYKVNAALSEGDWTSNGMADVMVAYDPKFLSSEKFSLLLEFRYSAINASAKIDSKSYATILEGYGFGAQLNHKTFTNFTLVGLVEPTLYRVSFRSTDHLETEETPKQNKSNVVVGVGGDYTGREKVRIGPRILVGAGAVKTAQFGVSGSFLF